MPVCPSGYEPYINEQGTKVICYLHRSSSQFLSDFMWSKPFTGLPVVDHTLHLLIDLGVILAVLFLLAYFFAEKVSW